MRQRYNSLRKRYFDTKEAEEAAGLHTGGETLIPMETGTLEERFSEQREQLAGIERVGLAAKEATDSIMVHMQRQSEKIRYTSGKVRNTGQGARLAQRLVDDISWNEYCYRVGLYLAIVALLAVIVLLLVYKYKSSNPNNYGQT